MKLLAIDIGSKRVGVALWDSSGGPPLACAALSRQGGRAERELLRLLSEHGISSLIVGLPLNEDGTRSAQCCDIEGFCRRITRRIGVTINYVDEYASSFEAEENLRERGGVSAADRRRGIVDSVAAALILQRYLERENLR